MSLEKIAAAIEKVAKYVTVLHQRDHKPTTGDRIIQGISSASGAVIGGVSGMHLGHAAHQGGHIRNVHHGMAGGAALGALAGGALFARIARPPKKDYLLTTHEVN